MTSQEREDWCLELTVEPNRIVSIHFFSGLPRKSLNFFGLECSIVHSVGRFPLFAI